MEQTIIAISLENDNGEELIITRCEDNRDLLELKIDAESFCFEQKDIVILQSAINTINSGEIG